MPRSKQFCPIRKNNSQRRDQIGQFFYIVYRKIGSDRPVWKRLASAKPNRFYAERRTPFNIRSQTIPDENAIGFIERRDLSRASLEKLRFGFYATDLLGDKEILEKCGNSRRFDATPLRLRIAVRNGVKILRFG